MRNGLIENSVCKAQKGTEVASEVATGLAVIVCGVTKVTDFINCISKASEEQAKGVDQFSIAASQMDKVTQQNESGAEESASAAEQLSTQANTVKGIVNKVAPLLNGAGAGDATPSNRRNLHSGKLGNNSRALLFRFHQKRAAPTSESAGLAS